MRCLTAREVEEAFGGLGFRVSFEHAWYRIALYLKGIQQYRTGCHPSSDLQALRQDIVQLNRWLPSNRGRLLWVDHSDSMYPSVESTFLAVKAGLGEQRSLDEAPGHYFDAFPWDEEDQTAISPEQANETDVLIGLTSLMMVGAWDGWLIASDCGDRIEFWESNLFFHSADQRRMAAAEELIAELGWSRQLR